MKNGAQCALRFCPQCGGYIPHEYYYQPTCEPCRLQSMERQGVPPPTTPRTTRFKSHYCRKVEAQLGRCLTIGEVVHHIDLNHRNNELSNLQVMTRSEHRRLHRRLWQDVQDVVFPRETAA